MRSLINILYFKKPLKRLYGVLLKPFFKKGVEVNIGGAGNFRLDYIFAFSRFSDFGDKHNAGFKKWLAACEGRKAVFDIGAHIGLYSIPASSVMRSGSFIYAFEPSEANRFYLERHIRLNSVNNIKVFPYMVGDGSAEESVFYENRDVDGMDSIAIVKNRDSYNKVFKRQVSLDDFCEKEGVTPEIIKIDVEGGELNVLKGAANLLKRSGPVIFLSAHPSRLAAIGQSAGELAQFISDIGYAAYNAEGGRAEALNFGEYTLMPAKRN